MWLWPFAREPTLHSTDTTEILYDVEESDGWPPFPRRPAWSTLAQTHWPSFFQPMGLAKKKQSVTDDPDDHWPTPSVKYLSPSVIPGIGDSQRSLFALQSVKRGTFDGYPATLVILTVRHADYRTRNSFRFRLRVRLKGEERARGAPLKAWWIAFAPQSVRLPGRPDLSVGGVKQTNSGNSWEIHTIVQHFYDRYDTPGVPYRLRLAALVGHHGQDDELQVCVMDGTPWPPRPCFARKPTEPVLNVDSKHPNDDSLIICAQQSGSPCVPHCTDFSVDHMTDKVWRDVLFVPRDRQRYLIEKDSRVSLRISRSVCMRLMLKTWAKQLILY